MRATLTTGCLALLLVAAGYVAWPGPSVPTTAIPADASPEVKAAIVAMSSSDPAARAAAAQRLGAWPYRANTAIPFLIGLLGDTAGVPDPLPPVPAQAAADTLARMEEPAIAPVAMALTDPSPAVRKRAAWVLGRIGKPEAVNALTEALWDKDASVRAAVLTALAGMKSERTGLLDDPAPPDVAGLILPMLRDRDPVVRAEAARVLPVTGEDRVVKSLIAALKDPDPRVRIAVAQALPATADSRTVEPLLETLCDPEPQARIAAMEALIESYDRRAKEPLFALFRDKSPQIRQAAIEQLGRIPSRHTMRLLMTAMKDEDADVRAAATVRLSDLLSSLGKKRTAVRESFIAALQDPSAAVRVAALAAIPQLGVPNAQDLVQPMLKDPDPYVRRDAISVLYRVWRPGGPPRELILPLAADPNPMVRRAALRYVGWYAEPKRETLETLIADLSDPSAVTRAHAASSLEEYEDERALGPLLAHVHDPSATVRAAVVSALRPFDHPRAVEAVKVALADGDVRVEQSAAQGFSESGFSGEGGRLSGRGRGGGRGGGGMGGVGWLGGD